MEIDYGIASGPIATLASGTRRFDAEAQSVLLLVRDLRQAAALFIEASWEVSKQQVADETRHFGAVASARETALSRRSELFRWRNAISPKGDATMEWIMNWWWATVLGPIVLAGGIAYALLTRRRLTRGERAAQHRGIEEVYKPSKDV